MKTIFIFCKQGLLLSGVEFALFFALSLVTGCGAVGMVAGGSIDQFTGTYGIKLDTARADIYDAITEVGKEMDMSLYELDTTSHKIVLSSGYSTASASLIGKSSASAIAVQLDNTLKDLSVGVTVQGNFGYGKKENADKIFNDFKTKLLTKLKQS